MANSPYSVLVVDDEANVRKLLSEIFTKEGYRVTTANNGQQALELVAQSPFDLVVMDIRMPVMNGLEAFHVLREHHPNITVIITTAFVSISTAIEAMKLGAYNYISKPFDITEVKLNVRRALEIKELTHEVEALRQEIQNRFSMNNIIGKSGKMQEIYKTIGKVADTNATVLIQGESGTGKELVAKAIHYNSRRKKHPLVKVNCAALPESLLESEIFGYEKGAFTGATDMKMGKFEFAHGGTLFLDEISEMSPALQVKLLRVIQEKEFERIGGLKTIKVDVRIIAASNRNLQELIKTSDFRKDIYYRLNVVPLYIPSLNERKEDIPLLAEYFINKYNQEMKTDVKHVSPETMSMIMAYHWPGNVRELENVIERAMVMGSGSILLPENLPMGLQSYAVKADECINYSDKPLREILQTVEKRVIKIALDRNDWNKSQTARQLQMSRQALTYKIEEYDLKR